MRDTQPEELAKLHCLRHLFGLSAGEDSYLADQIRKAIERALTGSEDGPAPLSRFMETALRLCEAQRAARPSRGLYHLDLRGGPFDPLWARQELLKALRHLSGRGSALLLVTGLRGALQGRGRYWTRRRRERHRRAVQYIDQLASRWAAPRGVLTILYL